MDTLWSWSEESSWEVCKNVKVETQEVKITYNDTDGGRFLTFECLTEFNSADIWNCDMWKCKKDDVSSDTRTDGF